MSDKIKRHINTYKYAIPQDEQSVNKTFVRGTVYILDCVQIANKTKFVKEYVDKASYGLDYLPVVGYYIDGDFQDHAIDYYFDEDGNLKEEVLTIPYGVVIAGTKRWEKVFVDEEIRDVLAVDCYFWRDRNPEAIDKVMQNTNSQSMEITIDTYENKENYIEVKDFNFTSLCILGNGVRPAFEVGKVKVDSTFSKSDSFKIEYEEMLKALNNYIEEGSTQKVEDNKTTNIEGSQIDKSVLPKEEDITPVNKEPKVNTQEEEFACGDKKKKKMEEDTSNEVNYEEKYNELNGQFSDLQAKNKELENQYNALMEEVLTLREYKLDKEKEYRESKEAEIFSKFEDIAKDESFIELKNNSAKYSLEELEDKAYAIYGKINKTKSEKGSNKETKKQTEDKVVYNTIDNDTLEGNKITNSISELVNKYKNK